MRTLLIYSIATALVGLVFCGHASADPVVLFNSLGGVSAGADPVGDTSPGVPWGPIGASFSTGSDPFSLGDVQLLLSGDNTSPGSITVSLLNDSSTSPGSLIQTIGTLSDSLLTSSASVYDLPVTPLSLTPNTRYWIELSTTDSSTAAFWWTGDYSGPGVATEYFFNSYQPGDVFPNDPNGPYQMEVSSAVPEPISLVRLSGLGGMGLIGLVWRRRRAAA